METTMRTFRCNRCGDLFKDEEPERINNKDYCKECAENDFGVCDFCGDKTLHDDLTYSEHIGSQFCQDCIGEYVLMCDWCNKWELTENTFSCQNDIICSHCADNTGVCNGCGERFRVDDLHYSERDGEDYCDNCFEPERDNEFLYDAGYKPEPIFYGETGGFFMGIENEVDLDTENCEDFTNDFFYCKEDGSIEGFEIVSHPFTLEYEKEHFELKNMCEELQRRGSNIKNGYGLHVHVSRRLLKEETAKKIAVFFWENRQFMLEISGRTQDKITRWAKFYQYTREHYLTNEDLSHDRYNAINICPKNTVEFRFFRGVKHFNILMGCLEVIQGLVEFCNVTDIDAVTLENFKRYLEDKGFTNALYLINKREGRQVDDC